MMVFGEAFETDPEYAEGQTDFWCNCTSQSLGPDGSWVALQECRSPERSCYREY
jgi:hypothetical protein